MSPQTATTAANMLVVLDLNGVLCETATTRGNRIADCVARKKFVFMRPRLAQFLEFLFARFDVAVWTSCPYFSARPLVEAIFGTEYMHRLKFVFTRTNCKYNPVKKYGTLKDLTAIWNQFPCYGSHNTLLLEDDANKVVQYDCWIEVLSYRYANKEHDAEFERLQKKLQTLELR